MREDYNIQDYCEEGNYVGINEARDLMVFGTSTLYSDLRDFRKGKTNTLFPWYLHYGISFLPASYVWMKIVKPGWLSMQEYGEAAQLSRPQLCLLLRTDTEHRYTVQDLSDSPHPLSRKRYIYAPEFEKPEGRLKKLESVAYFKESVVFNLKDYIPVIYIKSNPTLFPGIDLTNHPHYHRFASASKEYKDKLLTIREYPLAHKDLIEDKLSPLYIPYSENIKHTTPYVTLSDIARKFNVSRQAVQQWAKKGYLEKVTKVGRNAYYKDIDEKPIEIRKKTKEELSMEGYLTKVEFSRKYGVKKPFIDYYIKHNLVEVEYLTEKTVLIKDPGEKPKLKDNYIPVAELADKFSTTSERIYRLIRAGRLKSTANEDVPGILLVENVDKLPKFSGKRKTVQLFTGETSYINFRMHQEENA